jgi:hypothetical protein
LERKHEGRLPLKGTDTDGIITLEYIKRSRMGGCELDSCDPGWRPTAGSCEHGINIWVPFNAGNLLTNSVTAGFLRTALSSWLCIYIYMEHYIQTGGSFV